jgi:ribosomal 50S subunit-recycling heat shock protein
MSIKLGEVQAKMSADVKKTEELSVSLKVSWSDKLETVKFKPSEDLKKGDTVKITIEKV